ncbi:hypothetical protein D9M71_413160 [compost metagenome]
MAAVPGRLICALSFNGTNTCVRSRAKVKKAICGPNEARAGSACGVTSATANAASDNDKVISRDSRVSVFAVPLHSSRSAPRMFNAGPIIRETPPMTLRVSGEAALDCKHFSKANPISWRIVVRVPTMSPVRRPLIVRLLARRPRSPSNSLRPSLPSSSPRESTMIWARCRGMLESC